MSYNQIQDILYELGMLDEDGNCPYTAEELFKAGVEWMAEQGETAEVGYWNQRGLSLLLDKPLEKLGYKEGDRVAVQIRKMSK